MQVDLLRVLQEGCVRPIGSEKEERVDVRVIAASNKSLAKLVQKGRFREDLFYRLSVVDVQLPPLRERPDDIPLLIEHFLARFAERFAQPAKRLSRGAVGRLVAHPLPGNVRQLEHLLLHAWVLVEGALLTEADLGLDAPSAAPMVGRAPPSGSTAVELAPSSAADGAALPENVDAHKSAEKRRILEALEASGWNRVRAAVKLGIPRRTFYRRLREHGILES